MSTIEGGQTPRGGELPKKQELTVADLLAEVRAHRPGEEADLEAPILAERTAGKVANITQPTADIRENTSSRSQLR